MQRGTITRVTCGLHSSKMASNLVVTWKNCIPTCGISVGTLTEGMAQWMINVWVLEYWRGPIRSCHVTAWTTKIWFCFTKILCEGMRIEPTTSKTYDKHLYHYIARVSCSRFWENILLFFPPLLNKHKKGHGLSLAHGFNVVGGYEGHDPSLVALNTWQHVIGG